MATGGEAFARTAAALAALARRDENAYAVGAGAPCSRDFEARDLHLTGVAIADTALVLERLAGARGLAQRPSFAAAADRLDQPRSPVAVDAQRHRVVGREALGRPRVARDEAPYFSTYAGISCAGGSFATAASAEHDDDVSLE